MKAIASKSNGLGLVTGVTTPKVISVAFEYSDVDAVGQIHDVGHAAPGRECCKDRGG